MKRLHGAVIVALKRNVTFNLTTTVTIVTKSRCAYNVPLSMPIDILHITQSLIQTNTCVNTSNNLHNNGVHISF